MARIRTIKPEFFTSEDIVGLTPLARLLYIALWCEADKEGRLVFKPKTLKMRYFPGDSLNIEKLCGELTDGSLLVCYGDGLAYIPKFGTHQHVNPRETESKLPAPDGISDLGPKKVGKSTRLAVFERDNHACVRCGSTDRLEADHILPQSCGGPHIIENLRTLCKSCNAARPVAGSGLLDDLAKDGYSLESLRAKFGIDASILDMHAQVGREGKGKEGKGREGNEIATPDGVSDSVFQDFKKLRAAKKSPLTQTALDGITREAAKAGLTLSTVLEMCCERGWVGFKAEWTLEKETAKSTETAYQKSMRLRVAEVSPELAKQAPEENPINFFKTIDVESRRIA